MVKIKRLGFQAGLAIQLGNTFAMTTLGGVLKIEGDLAAAN